MKPIEESPNPERHVSMVADEEEFTESVEALFIRLLDVVAELRHPLPYQALTSKCRQIIDATDHQLSGHPEWPDAKYAVIAWVDSEIRAIDDEWKNLALERHYTKSYEAYDRFFERAQDAISRQAYQACECFYLSFMFGYRGVYGEENPSKLRSGWPGTKREWQKTVAGLVRVGRRRRMHETRWERTFECPVAPDFEELSGPSLLRSGLIFFALSLLVALPFLLYRFFN